MVHPEGFGVDGDDIEARLRVDFSEDDRSAAEAVLARCDPIPESLRVQYAVLELANGDLELLRYYAERAETDYRDVLYWAFYIEDDLDDGSAS